MLTDDIFVVLGVEALTSTLLQQQLHAPLVFLLLLRESAVRVELCAVEGVFQPLHQPLLLVQLHLQLGQRQLQLSLLLAQRHHLLNATTPVLFRVGLKQLIELMMIN